MWELRGVKRGQGEWGGVNGSEGESRGVKGSQEESRGVKGSQGESGESREVIFAFFDHCIVKQFLYYYLTN